MLRTLMGWDANLTDQMRLRPGVRGWKAMSFLAHSGDSWFWLAGLGLVWLLGTPDWRRLAAILAVSLVFEAVLVLSIKLMIRRRRPEGEWGGIYRATDPHSFPSGHAARAALLAVMAMALGPAWFGWLVVLWSPVVAAARVLMGVHYVSDVVVGYLLGLLVGWGMVQLAPWMVAAVPFLF